MSITLVFGGAALVLAAFVMSPTLGFIMMFVVGVIFENSKKRR